MSVDVCSGKGYHIITFRGDGMPGVDHRSLKPAIMECLHRKIVNIALLAEPAWQPCARSLEALAECNRIIRNHGGSLAVIQDNEPNLRLLAFIAGIKVYLSERDLPAGGMTGSPAAG